MLDPQTAIGVIFSVAKYIYNHVKEAEENKGRKTEMLNRLIRLTETMQKISKLDDSKQALLQENLNNLTGILQKLELLIIDLNKTGKIKKLKRIFNSDSIKKALEDFSTNVDKGVQDLHIAMTTAHMLSSEEQGQLSAVKFDEAEKRLEEILGKNIQLTNQMDNVLQKQDNSFLELQKVRNQVEELYKAITTAKPDANNSPKSKPSLLEKHNQNGNLQKGEPIVDGLLGHYFHGTFDNEPVTIKEFDLNSEFNFDQVEREVSILKKLRHGAVARFRHLLLDKENKKVYLIMDPCEIGSLAQYLKHNKLTLAQQKKIAMEMARGLMYIHKEDNNKKGLLHRNLSTEIIFLDKDLQPKFTEFSAAKTSDKEIQTAKLSPQSFAYVAPEALQSKALATAKSDVYSLGLIIFAIYSGKEPFAKTSFSNIFKEKSNDFKEDLASLPPEIAVLVTQCCAQDPSQRPEVGEILKCLDAYQLTQSNDNAVGPSVTQAIPPVAMKISALSALSQDSKVAEYLERIKKGSTSARPQLAAYLANAKEFEAAKEVLEEAIKVNPQDIYSLHTLARMYKRNEIGTQEEKSNLTNAKVALHYYLEAVQILTLKKQLQPISTDENNILTWSNNSIDELEQRLHLQKGSARTTRSVVDLDRGAKQTRASYTNPYLDSQPPSLGTHFAAQFSNVNISEDQDKGLKNTLEYQSTGHRNHQ